MTEIAEPLRPVRTLAKPKRFGPMRGFSCGGRGNSWESLVNEWARDVYLGRVEEPQTITVLQDAADRLIGVASFRPEPLPSGRGRLVRGAQCLHMIAIDRRYRRQRLSDGSRLGDLLLTGTLAQIKSTCGNSMPFVWALVAPNNRPGHALLERHGFAELPYAGEGEIIRVRPPQEGLALLRSPADRAMRAIRWIARRGGESAASAQTEP